MTEAKAKNKARQSPPVEARPAKMRKGRPTAAESRLLDEHIKTSALDCFLQFGFEAVSMDTIAASAGITKRTLYARYVDKESLFREVLTWALVQWRELNLEVDIDPEGYETLEEKLEHAAGVLLDRELNIKVVQLARVATSQVNRFPELFGQDEGLKSMRWSPRLQAIASILAVHADRGEVAVDDLHLTSELFISMIMGIPARLAAFGVFRDREFEQQRIREAVKLFLNGIRRQPGSGRSKNART